MHDPSTRVRPQPTTHDRRVRKGWRLPGALIQFLRSESRTYELPLAHLVIRIFRGLENYYDLSAGPVGLLERERRALHMSRWGYLTHGMTERVQALAEQGSGFDAPKTGSARRSAEPNRVRIERFENGETTFQNWNLPPALLADLRDEADRQGWGHTQMGIALLNLYAGFFPLPEAGAAALERDRLRIGLGRWEYLRHVWWRRAERVAGP